MTAAPNCAVRRAVAADDAARSRTEPPPQAPPPGGRAGARARSRAGPPRAARSSPARTGRGRAARRRRPAPSADRKPRRKGRRANRDAVRAEKAATRRAASQAATAAPGPAAAPTMALASATSSAWNRMKRAASPPLAPSAFRMARVLRLRSISPRIELPTPTPPQTSAVRPISDRNCAKRSTFRESWGEGSARPRISKPESGKASVNAFRTAATSPSLDRPAGSSRRSDNRASDPGTMRPVAASAASLTITRGPKPIAPTESGSLASQPSNG